MLKSRKER